LPGPTGSPEPTGSPGLPIHLSPSRWRPSNRGCGMIRKEGL
jgi:hypothetical protein